MPKMLGRIVLFVVTTFAMSRAVAGVVFVFEEVGPSVVITATGSLNLALAKPEGFGGLPEGQLSPSGALIVGPDDDVVLEDNFYGVKFSGPASFGIAKTFLSFVGSGEIVGFEGGGGIIVPYGYQSGESLWGSSTFLHQTIETLGLIPGTYVYSYGDGPNADRFTLQIPVSRPMPEPDLLALLGIGWLAVGTARVIRAVRTVVGRPSIGHAAFHERDRLPSRTDDLATGLRGSYRVGVRRPSKAFRRNGCPSENPPSD